MSGNGVTMILEPGQQPGNSQAAVFERLRAQPATEGWGSSPVALALLRRKMRHEAQEHEYQRHDDLLDQDDVIVDVFDRLY